LKKSDTNDPNSARKRTLVLDPCHPRLLAGIFPYGFDRSFPEKLENYSKYRNGMVVAESIAIAFVPTKFGRG